jgi:hypothetical protein
MSRLSRLATVVRVAELRETVARGQVAAATAEVTAARTEQADREAVLAGSAFDGSDVSRSVAVLGWRAAAVRAAEQEVERAGAARLTALAGRVDAARHATLLRRLSDRLLAEETARRISAEQKTVDDSTGARHLREQAR